MKLTLYLIFVSVFILTGFAVLAQDTTSPAQSAEELRAKLQDVQAQEAELKARAEQLDEALKPENIERSLAGIGSTRPEELRELRRRELTNEKNSVLQRLDLLATSRVRLESAIQLAETQAYHQSAQGAASPLNHFSLGSYLSPRLLVGWFAGLLVIVAIAGIVFVIRKL